MRSAVNQGLMERAKRGVKVRQPLNSITVAMKQNLGEGENFYSDILRDELNIKTVTFKRTEGTDKPVVPQLEIDWEITPELKREGLMRELIRQVQTARKAAGLNVDDRIQLHIVSGEDEVVQTLQEHAETIAAETLATKLNDGNKPDQYAVDLTVEGYPVEIALAKA